MSVFKAPIVLLFIFLFSVSLKVTAKPTVIDFSVEHSETVVEIINQLSTQHFRKHAFDDEFSSAYLDQLLNSLDPNKFIFLQSDIDEIEAYRVGFDDGFTRGDLSAGAFIVERYLQRANERLEWAIERLSDQSYTFDFSLKESYELESDEGQWAQTTELQHDLWRQQLKFSVLNLILAGDSEDLARETITKRFQNQLQQLSQRSSDDIFEILMNSLTHLYDPHTSYLSPRTLENFNIAMSLSLEGIGAVLQSEDGYTKVVRLIKAGPADKNGVLKSADRIIAVGQNSTGEMVDVVGWKLDDVVDLVRGPQDTTVRLTIIPSDSVDESDYQTISIVRDKVKLEEQAAKKAVFNLASENGDIYKVGIIHVPTFYVDFEAYRRQDPNFKSTTRDVYRLLRELEDENIDGLIIDLRDNGGGSLQEAATLTDLFVDRGPVVQIRETNDQISRRFKSRMPAVYRGPLAVLTNRLSASASEIFAGAIQDYNRGLIIGGQSFGKGTVQSLTPLQNGQLKITESKFYRISGDSTQHRGVIPDIQFPSMIDISEVGESSYDTALPWDQIHPVSHEQYFNFSSVLPSLIELHEQRKAKDPDFQHILRQMDAVTEARNKKVVSLNLSERKEEKLAAETRSLTNENIRRQAKGLEPYISIDDWKEQRKVVAAEEAASTDITLDNDPYLAETGYILIDLLELMKQNKVAVSSSFKPC